MNGRHNGRQGRDYMPNLKALSLLLSKVFAVYKFCFTIHAATVCAGFWSFAPVYFLAMFLQETQTSISLTQICITATQNYAWGSSILRVECLKERPREHCGRLSGRLVEETPSVRFTQLCLLFISSLHPVISPSLSTRHITHQHHINRDI